MRLFNNRGEGGTGDAGGDKGAGDAGGAGEAKFTQADVDRIVNKRFGEVKTLEEQNAELSKFKSEHEKQADATKQKQLEEQGAYEEAKKVHETKLAEAQGVISQKDQTITDMKIGNALQAEINRQNAVPEVAQLIKGSAVVQDDGSIKIKGKDANGIDTLLPLEQGVAEFLKAKPYFVKTGKQGGSGSGTGAGQGDDNASGKEDLNSLNTQLANAMARGDSKLATEIAAKIKKQQVEAGVSSFI